MDVPPRDLGAVFEVNAWGGYMWRGGNLIVKSLHEVEELPLAGGGAMFASPVFDYGLVQLEFDGEGAFDNEDVNGVPANESYSGGFTGGGHLGYTRDNFLIGAFGGAGRTYFFDSFRPGYDVTQWLAGGQARYLNERGSLAVQAGYFDTRSDNGDMETLSDTYFVRAIAQVFFNNGSTMLEGSVAYADGTQDEDDGPTSDPAYMWAWEIVLEHQLAMLSSSNAAATVFVSYEGIQVTQQFPIIDSQSLMDQGIYAGLKFRFGAQQNLYEREMSTAPGLPNVHRWLGAVPAID